jgi:hypothetical protein
LIAIANAKRIDLGVEFILPPNSWIAEYLTFVPYSSSNVFPLCFALYTLFALFLMND